MRRGRISLAAAAVLLLQVGGAANVAAAPTPSPAASPSPSPSVQCADSDTSSLCQQKRALDQVRARLEGNLASARAAQAQLEHSVAENLAEQRTIRDRVTEASARIEGIDSQLQEQARQISALEVQIEHEQAQVRVLARALYYAPSSVLVLLASARSASDLLTGTADLLAAAGRATRIERTIAGQRAALAALRSRTEDERSEQARNRDAMTTGLERLAELHQQQLTSSSRLALAVQRTQAEIAAVDRQSADVAGRIALMLQQQQEQAIADAMQQAWAQAQLWILANPGVPGISAGHSHRYRFVWPEPRSQITQGFGPTDLALEPAYLGFPHFHMGIDLAAPEGTPVLAADDGVVAVVGDGTTGYGRFVILSHRDGLTTLYGHLAQPVVKVGDQVVQGQPVGMEGSTGYSTGPHVHFELRVAGVPRDPTPLLPPGAPSPYSG